MAQIFHQDLPPIRRKILARFLAVVGLYAIFGVIMISAVFLASRMTPKVIHLNYDSIAAAHQMKHAWSALKNPALYPKETSRKQLEDFEKALAFEERNITEPNEDALAKKVREIWEANKARLGKISNSDFHNMIEHLNGLVSINEQAMFRAAQASSVLTHNAFLGGSAFFLITLIIVIFIADGVTNRLAFPIKKVAEVLRSRPALGAKLKLPAPTSLELKILNHELTQLWNRLTELKELDVARINTQKEQLTSILAFVDDAILVLDNKGTIVHCNAGVEKMIQLASKDIIGHPWSDLPTTGENYIFLRTVISDVTQHQTIQLSVDGRQKAYSIRFREIKNIKDEVVATLYLFHDVTESRQADKLRREFIGVLSHEIKTPLQSLSICADVLQGYRDKIDADGQLLIDTIHEDVSRIRAVANDFMQVGVEDLHSLRLRLESIELGKALEEWLRPFRVLAKDKNIKFNYQKHGDSLFFARIDKVKFPWIISNLLSNAIRVSPKGSEITIVLQQAAQNILISISDQGPGISEHTRGRMFEPYFQGQLPGASQEASGFLGLGLTIAKEVVEAHSGSISFSPNLPTGAVFKVSVPLAQPLGLQS